MDVSDPSLFASDGHWAAFKRLRAEDPVHFRAESRYGPYWSLTGYHDIDAVDRNHRRRPCSNGRAGTSRKLQFRVRIPGNARDRPALKERAWNIFSATWVSPTPSRRD